MTVDDAYKLVLYIVKKNQGDGYVSQDEFNRTINVASNSFYDYLLQELQQRSYPRQGLGNSQVVRRRLAPVIYGRVLSIDSTGFTPYPADYVQVDAMWSIYGYNDRIRFSQQDNLYSYVGSTIDPVETNPVYIIEEQGFRFFPNSLWQARMSYFRRPTDIYWASIYGPNQRPIYDAGNSIDPVWDDIDMLEVIARALRIVGVNLQTQDVSMYANEIKQAGQ